MAEFVQGLEKVFNRAKRLERDARNLTAPVRKGGEIMLASIRKNFAVGGRPKWSPLAASTKKRKKGRRILVETGELLASHELNASGNSAEAGTNLDRAKYPYGGTRKMPRRNAILFQPEDISQIGKVFCQHFARK